MNASAGGGQSNEHPPAAFDPDAALRSIAARRLQIACAIKSIRPAAGLASERPLPRIDDRHPVLAQSLAIIEQLDERHPYPPLLPADPVLRARVRAIAMDLACELHPLSKRGAREFLRRLAAGTPEDLRAWYRHWLERGLAAAAARVAETPPELRFCAGDHPSLADVCLVAHLAAARPAACALQKFPRLMQIDAECRTLPAFADNNNCGPLNLNHPEENR